MNKKILGNSGLEVTSIGNKYDRSAGEIAIAWTLKHPAVTAAIVGARNAKQIDGVRTASEVKLTPQEILDLENFTSVPG
jgi:aryl-alcohol dehydrogenase-like predicted oxidoreductase